MKKFYFLIMFTLGVMPYIHNGSICLYSGQRAVAQDPGSEYNTLGTWGDHGVGDEFDLLPVDGNSHVASPGQCEFSVVEWASKYLSAENTISSVENWYADLKGTQPWVVDAGGVQPGDYQTVLDHYFNTEGYSTAQEMRDAIDNNYLISAVIETGTYAGQPQGHDVMITGYNDDGTFQYYDPASCTYHSAPVTAFDNPVGLTGVKSP